ncbi:Transposase DDE domain-containing protein [Flavobacterium cucumis]|uniref:Uncharacterized protein n=1 Tax=Flavobacterium cucumis TaxID=416016 RepID=A0A1M7ZY52_9FLAO|nr:hypothetical protein SAMN05443547_1929 [Flavobacterium cucumis]
MEYFGIKAHLGGLFLLFNRLKFHLITCKIFLLFLEEDKSDICQTNKRVMPYYKPLTT